MADNSSSSKIILPEPTIRRLPWYLAYVSMLHADNVEYVSSTQIAKELNVDSSQIAKDLSFLNIKGKTRIGYEVKSLERELRGFLGFKTIHPTIILGCGSLGSALIQDVGLQRYGLKIVAGYDVNPEIVGTTICGVPIFDIADIESRRKLHKAEIAIISVPVENAQDAADTAIAAGIKALWNFTPFRIRATEDIVIQNTSISAHLAVMFNRLNSQNKK